MQDVMTVPPLAVSSDASLQDAADLFAASQASDLMVVAADGQLVGVLSEGDLIRAVLPDVPEILGAGGSVEDAMAALLRKGAELGSKRVTPYLITEPITVAPTDHVGVAAAALIDRNIRRLPVVTDGRLVGTVSRSDVVDAILRETAS